MSVLVSGSERIEEVSQIVRMDVGALARAGIGQAQAPPVRQWYALEAPAAGGGLVHAELSRDVLIGQPSIAVDDVARHI